jgi:putative membrane protein
MKKIQFIQKIILQLSCLSALFVSINSCNNATNKDDAKKIAEEHNDAKYDKTSKENDAQFLVNAAEASLNEIKLGGIAQDLGSVQIVKDLGKLMASEHQTSMNQLIELAQTKQMTIPVVTSTSSDVAKDLLIVKKGKEFDLAYCDMMVAGHKKSVDLFEKAKTNSNDIDIKNWAIATLPNLRMHLDSALNCQRMCGEIK